MGQWWIVFFEGRVFSPSRGRRIDGPEVIARRVIHVPLLLGFSRNAELNDIMVPFDLRDVDTRATAEYCRRVEELRATE